MRKAVIYKSVLGTTKQYSTWLSNKIGADVFRWYLLRKEDLARYDILVVASGPYENWDPLAKFLMRNWDVLKDKKVVVMAIGEIPSEEGVKWRVHEKIPGEIKDSITYFELPGKLNPETADQIKEENLKPIIEHVEKLEKEEGIETKEEETSEEKAEQKKEEKKK